MSEQSADETYLEVDMEAEAGTGPATAIILESVAEVLRDAPEGYRCDFELAIEESGGGSYDIEKDPDGLTEPETGIGF